MAPNLRLLIIAAAVLLSGPAWPQAPEASVRLGDFDPANVPDYPFGITMDPDGLHAYIAVSGNYGSTSQNNRRLLKVDVWTRAIVAEAQVGLFPEDIAVTRDSSGLARHVFVTVSTSSEVAVLTPSLLAVATIPLGACPPLASHFPFGIAASPDNTRVCVTTLAGCGTVFIIDADPASPAFATVLHTHHVPGGHGRPVFAGPFLFVPTSVFAQNFGLSQGAAALLDPSPQGGVILWSVLTPPVGGTFVAAVDSALLPAGRVLMTMNGEATSSLYEVDPSTGTVVRTIPLGPAAGSAIHGLGISPDGRVAVATSQDSHLLLFVDLAQGALLSTVSTGPATQPNEVAFTRDGSRLWATLQTFPAVRIYSQLPLRDLWLSAPATAPQGGSAPLMLSNGDFNQTVAVFVSGGPGPSFSQGLTILLSEPYYLLASGMFGPEGTVALPVFVPPSPPPLAGLTFYLQAITQDRDGAVRLSNGLAISIL